MERSASIESHRLVFEANLHNVGALGLGMARLEARIFKIEAINSKKDFSPKLKKIGLNSLLALTYSTFRNVLSAFFGMLNTYILVFTYYYKKIYLCTLHEAFFRAPEHTHHHNSRIFQQSVQGRLQRKECYLDVLSHKVPT